MKEKLPIEIRNAVKAAKTAAKCLKKLKTTKNTTFQQRQSWKYHIAKAMKQAPTKCESILWGAIYYVGAGYGWQVSPQVQVGPYIVDFQIRDFHQKRIVIVEADGEVHKTRVIYDRQRDSYLKSKGYRVLRFSNSLIIKDIIGVLKTIAEAVND